MKRVATEDNAGAKPVSKSKKDDETAKETTRDDQYEADRNNGDVLIVNKLAFKNTSNYKEKEINSIIIEHIKKKLKNNNKSNEEKSLQDVILYERRLKCLEWLENLIINGQEREMIKFNDLELKLEMKICYELFQKLRKYAETGEKPETNHNDAYIINNISKILESNDWSFKSDFFKKLKDIKHRQFVPRNDMSNLLFLKELYRNLINSKIKIYLQYISNVDHKLFQYFKEFFDLMDIHNIIFLLTELKVFLRILIENFKQCNNGINAFSYEYKITKETNVIHR
jgi:hypothetical protein